MNSVKNEEGKICRYCAESIPAKAKLCPRCRQWLTFRSFRNPMFIMVTMILPVFGMLALGVRLIGNLMNPPPYYSDQKNSLQILNSDMNWAETSDGSRIFLTGILTNRSEIAW